jgi:hypothetical protein
LRSLLGSLWITALAAGLLLGCGDEDPGPMFGEDMRRLVILDPPSDSVGLGLGAGSTLRVRYEDAKGVPISGAAVAFTFEVGPTENTGGASLSGGVAQTDTAGLARVDVVAGADEAKFRVRAEAKAAQPVMFSVSVSADGFSDLKIRPVHVGGRDESDLRQIELRLFRGGFTRCGDIEIDNPPESVFPPRSLPGFTGSATFQNLSARESYTVLVWAAAKVGGRPLAAACATLAEYQLLPGAVLVQLPVADRPIEVDHLEAPLALDLLPVVNEIAARGDSRPWDILACPAGVGQLLLDCSLDAAIGDGDASDCLLEGAAADAPLAQAINQPTLRGTVGSDGCRPTTVAGGAPSLDQEIIDMMSPAGLWPRGANLLAFVATRSAIARRVTLLSEITITDPDVATHQLRAARFVAGTAVHEVDLTRTARPVLEQREVPFAVTDTVAAALGRHGFSLRLGSATEAAFVALALKPAGLAGHADELGTALANSLADVPAGTGCAALSNHACTEAGQAATCLESACKLAASLLDTTFTGWLLPLDGAGLDYHLEGTVSLIDADFDLRADALVNKLDELLPSITLADGAEIAVEGTFFSSPVPTP